VLAVGGLAFEFVVVVVLVPALVHPKVKNVASATIITKAASEWLLFIPVKDIFSSYESTI